MQLSRKQLILIVSLSGVALLLIAGLFFVIRCGGKRDPIPAEPSLPPATEPPRPSDTPSPSPTAEPTESPSPTPYFLPLVPEGGTGTPAPSSPPAPTPSGSPEAERPKDARDGVYNEQIREFMAIGTLNGEAVAVLLVHVEPPEATIVTIPCETAATVYTLSEGAAVERTDVAPIGSATARAPGVREGCWNLVWAVKNLTGWRAPEYVYVDLACMEAFFSFVPSLPLERGDVDLAAFAEMLNEEGEARARSMGEIGVGAARFLGRVSLWDLPAFRSATRGAFGSSLSVFDLLALMRALRRVDTFTVTVLPTEIKNGVRVLSDAAELPF
ncbi:MAG: hypothetical protein II872_01140 [Clostridia bacterium]|nr:hypothetical protein [Clostridia bacterium]